MSSEADQADELLDRARAGDPQALAELFDRYRDRLRHMVRLRLDRRLAGRLDASDVLQEAFIEASKRLAPRPREREMPAFLWLRLVTDQVLIDLHRRHLGAKMRDAGVEISIHRGPSPQASSLSLAEMLLGRFTSPTAAGSKGHAPHAAERRTPQPEFVRRNFLLDRRRREGTRGGASVQQRRDALRSELERSVPRGDLPSANIAR
jgi:DNA-directed RNA polymerase specialized sigma24 family protein